MLWPSKLFTAAQEFVSRSFRAALRDSAASKTELPVWKLGGILISLLSAAAGLVLPGVVSHPKSQWFHSAPVSARHAPVPIAYETTMVVEQVKRKVYPYSIVPGGAENVLQARQYMSNPGIKVHYAAFDLGQLKQVKLTTNLTGYVSYRWGDKIYWTAHKITLRKGETVFTDGAHIARGRCLNCYSALPMSPTRPNEPTEKAFDVPVEMPVTVYNFPKLPVMAAAIPIPPGELTPTVPVLPAVVPQTVGRRPGGGFWFPIIPIIPPIHRHPGHSPSGPVVPPPIPPPVAVVPEPRYDALLLAGFLAILVVFRIRRSRPQAPR